MKRRDILKYTTLMTGAAIGAPLLATILSGCKSDVGEVDLYKPIFFNSNEFSVIKDLVDSILPKTDSPAASKVGVHSMVDNMVGKVYKEEDKSNYKKGIAALFAYLAPAMKNDQRDFDDYLKLDAEKKLTTLQNLMNSTDEGLSIAKKSFLDLRQQTVAYYLSSEEIGKNYLNYLPVPGEYEACISLESVGGKAWAI